MRRGGSAKAGRVERVPLATGAQHKENRLGAHPVGHAGPPATKKCGFRCTGKSGSSKVQSSSVSPKQPPVLAMRLAWGRRRTFFLGGRGLHPPVSHLAPTIIRIGSKWVRASTEISELTRCNRGVIGLPGATGSFGVCRLSFCCSQTLAGVKGARSSNNPLVGLRPHRWFSSRSTPKG